MALGDLMASRFTTQSGVAAAVISNHLDDCGSSIQQQHHHQHRVLSNNNNNNNNLHDGDDDSVASSSHQRRDSDGASSSYGNNAAVTTITTAGTATSLAYLPQTVVLCELRHDAFEASTPTGPSNSGLVSKWRQPKDRVFVSFFLLLLCLCIS